MKSHIYKIGRKCLAGSTAFLALVAASTFAPVASGQAPPNSAWSGAGSDNLWSNTSNWVTFPAAGNDLSFNTTSQTTNVNDISNLSVRNFTLGGNTSASSWNLSGNVLALSGKVTNNGNASSAARVIALDLSLTSTNTSFEIATGTVLTVSGVISGASNLNFLNPGTLTLTGTNTLSGQIRVDGGGTLSINSINDAGIAGTLGTVSVLRLGNNEFAGTLVYTGGAASSNRRIQIGANTGPGGAVINNNGTGALTFSNASDAFNATFGGAGNRTLTLGGTFAGTSSIAGAIVDNNASATISVTKTGAANNVWALNGTNTYTGATTVNSGTLLINGSSNSSAATVNSGGLLGGTGSVGSATLNAGGAITPGSGGIGTFSTNNGNLTWNGEASGSFAQMKFELGGANASDRLALGTGILTKGTGSIFRFDFLGTGAANQTYTLMSFGSSSGFNVSDFTFTGLNAAAPGGSFLLNSNSLQFVTVPEPGTAALLGLSALAYVVFRRRRRIA